MEKITFFFEKKKGEKEREEEEMKALKERGRERNFFFLSSDDFRLFLSFSLSSAFSPRLQLTSPLKRKKQIRWFSSVVEHWSCKPGVPRSNLGISFSFFFGSQVVCVCGWVGVWGRGGVERERETHFFVSSCCYFFLFYSLSLPPLSLS